MKIKVNKYIETAFSIEDAQAIDSIIEAALKQDEKITIDFKGISFFTTLFFNNAIAKYVLKLNPQGYNDRFQIVGLSEVGETTYKHSYDNAIDYFKLSNEQRDLQSDIVKDIDEV